MADHEIYVSVGSVRRDVSVHLKDRRREATPLGQDGGIDSTTLEANAAMKSILRRDTGEDWKQYVVRLMKEEGRIDAKHEPTDEEIRRFDKGRKNKKVSNDEWASPVDPEARITQLKDGRTHLAYKAEHVVDLESDLILAAEIRPADYGDAQTLCDSVLKGDEVKA